MSSEEALSTNQEAEEMNWFGERTMAVTADVKV